MLKSSFRQNFSNPSVFPRKGTTCQQGLKVITIRLCSTEMSCKRVWYFQNTLQSTFELCLLVGCVCGFHNKRKIKQKNFREGVI